MPPVELRVRQTGESVFIYCCDFKGEIETLITIEVALCWLLFFF